MASDRKSIQTRVKKRREEIRKKNEGKKGERQRREEGGWEKKNNGPPSGLGVDFVSFGHKLIHMSNIIKVSLSLSPTPPSVS